MSVGSYDLCICSILYFQVRGGVGIYIRADQRRKSIQIITRIIRKDASGMDIRSDTPRE